MANGTDMLVELLPGLELQGFLNYTAAYSPALVTLALKGARHRLNRYLAQRLPSLVLASGFGEMLKLCSSERYVPLED